MMNPGELALSGGLKISPPIPPQDLRRGIDNLWKYTRGSDW